MIIQDAIKHSQSQNIPAIHRNGWVKGVIVKTDYGEVQFVRRAGDLTYPVNVMDVMADDWEVVE